MPDAVVNGTFEDPPLNDPQKLTVKGEDAKELMVAFSTRAGRIVMEMLEKRIWAKHRLPTWRGTPVKEVPFDLRLDQILINRQAYSITVQYRFVAQS